MKLVVTAAVIAAASMLGSTATQAQVTTYSSVSSFNAATANVSVATFEGTSNSTYVRATPFTGPGYSITASGNYLFQNDPTYTIYYYDWGSGDNLTFLPQGVLTITFTTPVNAFGIDLATFADDGLSSTPPGAPSTIYGGTIRVGTGQGNFDIVTGQRPNRTFFGATSNTAFSAVTLTGITPNAFPVVDNLRLGSVAVAAVPEPATWAMMIMGFGVVAGAMRRRRRPVAFA